MHKIDSSGHDNNQFVNKDPANDVAGTVVDADWLNAVQGELVAAIQNLGLTLDKEKSDQLWTALEKIYGKTYSGDPNGNVAADVLRERCWDTSTSPPTLYVATAADGTVGGTTWEVVAGASATTEQVFTSNGTWNKPAGCKRVKVTLVGGGGAGGGAVATGVNEMSCGGGGAGGDAVIHNLDVPSISSETVTVGAGGVANDGAAGGDGGDSSFGSHATAAGGFGGPSSSAAADRISGINGASSGGASSGEMVFPGGGGGSGLRLSIGTADSSSERASMGGAGGSPGYVGGAGGGGAINGGASNTGNSGDAGQDYGGGGGGAANGSENADIPGGPGGGGVVIVTEYYY